MLEKSTTPFFLLYIGIIVIIVGVACGLFFANTEMVMPLSETDKLIGNTTPTTENEFSWQVAIFWWILGLVGGCVLIGLSKAIKIIEYIAHNKTTTKQESQVSA